MTQREGGPSAEPNSETISPGDSPPLTKLAALTVPAAETTGQSSPLGRNRRTDLTLPRARTYTKN